MKAKQKNLVLFLIIAMVLCVCASCGKYYGSVKDCGKEKPGGHLRC